MIVCCVPEAVRDDWRDANGAHQPPPPRLVLGPVGRQDVMMDVQEGSHIIAGGGGDCNI